MLWLKRTLGSSIGAKAVMAITGAMLFGFLVAHLSGNLLMFAGPEAFNAYAEKLKSLGPLLWVARIGLLLVLVAHVATAARLTMNNRAARPVPYAHPNTVQATYASRTMPVSGLLVFLFVVYHLAHYTLHCTHPEYSSLYDSQGRHDVYRMVVLGFSDPMISGIYVFAMLILGAHLSHGLTSMFQSLGVHHPNLQCSLRLFGTVAAWLIALGFISIPLSVLAGLCGLAGGAL